MRIYLVGFMGAGKTMLGRQAALDLNVPFFDLDEMFIRHTQSEIADYFFKHGETSFRSIESSLLRSIQIEKAIISTGGGTPVHNDNMAWMCDQGITIYLSPPQKILFENATRHKQQRPLIASIPDKDLHHQLEMLLLDRRPYYEMAAITLSLKGQADEDLLLVKKACAYIW